MSISDVREDPALTSSFGYTSRDGVLVEQTFNDTPATGKLQPGDIITALAGKPVKDVQELRNTIAATPPGHRSEDDRLPRRQDRGRDGQDRRAAGRPDSRHVRRRAPRGRCPSRRCRGLKRAWDEAGHAQRQNRPGVRHRRHPPGTLVTEVDPKSPAAKAEIRKGDVITRVVDEDVQTAKQAADAIKKADQTKGIRLYISNSQASRFVVIKPTGS